MEQKPMRKILVCSASRAEKGLLNPVMIELEKRGDVKARWCLPTSTNLYDYNSVLGPLQQELEFFEPDIVLVPCDRWEMVYVASCAFNHGFIVAHFHAGDRGEGASDEMNRFAISFMSHILFCNSEESKQNLLRLGFEPERIFVVGSTALDHIEIDESLCPETPYDLVMLHPDSVSKVATERDLDEAVAKTKDSERIIWIGPNRDRNYEVIYNYLDTVTKAPHCKRSYHLNIYLNGILRPQFLGLLKNCSRAIGNSSAFVYELPFVNPEAELIKIGERNKERTLQKIKRGASARIAEILATIEINDKLKRKKLVI